MWVLSKSADAHSYLGAIKEFYRKLVRNHNLKLFDPVKLEIEPSQCAPGFFNPNQKGHGLFHFYIAVICKTDQNQLKKTWSSGLQNSNPKKNPIFYTKT